MGREVRRVPADWEHPKINAGGSEHFQPMYDRSYLVEMSEWREDKRKWDARECGNDEHYDKYTFEEWQGTQPDPLYFMPDWPEGERTHLMMYEDTTEGTPMSPAFETPEELARWCADNGASSFADMTATYEQWLNIARGGFACSMVVTGDGRMMSGVEASSPRKSEEGAS